MPALNPIALRNSVREAGSLSPREREAMHALMTEHYEAVPRERFEADLSRKDEVLMLHDDAGVLRGFTTLAWNPVGVFPEGDLLYSGDTIIDRSCWGTQELVRAFCRRAGEWQAGSGRRLFWFLISKGHRTYLYLPLFARAGGEIVAQMTVTCREPHHAFVRLPSVAEECLRCLSGETGPFGLGAFRMGVKAPRE